MSKSFFLLTLSLLSIQLSAQDKADRIRAQANKIGVATLALDYATILDYTYPAIIEMGGGREAMLDLMKSTFDMIGEQGLEFVAFEIGTPSPVVYAGDQQQCLVPTSTQIRLPEGQGILQQESDMIGISDDGGMQWTFVNTSNMTPEQVKELIPTYQHEQLGWPKKQAPKVLEE